MNDASFTIYPIGGRPKGFLGYQQIARPAGISVAALKKHLAAEGLIANDEPTKKAIVGEFAIRSALPENPAFPSPKGYRIMWSRDKVNAILEAAGATENAGYGIHHGHSASNQLNFAGQELDQDDSPDNIRRQAAYLEFEAHFDIIAARRGAKDLHRAREYLDEVTKDIVAFIKGRKAPTDLQISALRRIDSVRSWLQRR